MRFRPALHSFLLCIFTLPAAPQTTSTSTATNPPTATTLLDDAPNFPPGLPTTPTRSVKGIIRSVQCYYPTILSINFQQTAAPQPIAKPGSAKKAAPARPPANPDEVGKFVTLYTNNFYKVNFFTQNFTPTDPIQPCTNLVGLNATILFREASEKTNPSLIGQLTQVQLAK